MTCIYISGQFISERAQVEYEYSAKIEALGRKYSNSITEAAQNPLLMSHNHSTTTTNTTNTTNTTTTKSIMNNTNTTGSNSGNTNEINKNSTSGPVNSQPERSGTVANSTLRSSIQTMNTIANVATLGVLSSATKATTPSRDSGNDVGSTGLDDSNHGNSFAGLNDAGNTIVLQLLQYIVEVYVTVVV